MLDGLKVETYHLYTPQDTPYLLMNLADVLTKALPAWLTTVTFERLIKKCLASKRGEYYVKLSDEQVQYMTDEKTWMMTDLW